MATISHYSKSFLHNHSNLVDFLSASVIIIVCLVILLPKVHESFQPHEDDFMLEDEAKLENLQQPPPLPQLQPPVNPPNDHTHHHHNRVPVGEIIICFGFFAFYCIGLGLSQDRYGRESFQWSSSGRPSAVCCSSTRCPSERQDRPFFDTYGETFRETEPLTGGGGGGGGAGGCTSEKIDDNEDCVLLLNRHHNHHTHSRHHEHGGTSTQSYNHNHNHTNNGGKQASKRKLDYGSTSKIMAHDEQHSPSKSRPSPHHSTPKPATTIYVDQIRIISLPTDDDYKGCPGWPMSTKMTLFSLILAASLILFDMNVLGLIKTIRVFRAAATGALLYVAFFIILPRGSAGCKPCKEEESHRHL